MKTLLTLLTALLLAPLGTHFAELHLQNSETRFQYESPPWLAALIKTLRS